MILTQTECLHDIRTRDLIATHYCVSSYTK